MINYYNKIFPSIDIVQVLFSCFQLLRFSLSRHFLAFSYCKKDLLSLGFQKVIYCRHAMHILAISYGMHNFKWCIKIYFLSYYSCVAPYFKNLDISLVYYIKNKNSCLCIEKELLKTTSTIYTRQNHLVYYSNCGCWSFLRYISSCY